MAEVSGPGPQRHVQEIYIKEPTRRSARTRSRFATSCTRPTTIPVARPRLDAADPAWKAAEDEAERDATQARRRTPTCSTRSRRAESDESSALGRHRHRAASCPTSTRPARSTRRSRPRSWPRASRPATCSTPVKSAFGWHVIQVMYRPPDLDRLNALKTQADGGADFAALARDNSEARTAGAGATSAGSPRASSTER